MLRGAQTVANRDKTSTRVSRQDCQKTTQDECQKTSFRNRAEQYWLRPLSLPRTPLTLFLVRLRLRPISENG